MFFANLLRCRLKLLRGGLVRPIPLQRKLQFPVYAYARKPKIAGNNAHKTMLGPLLLKLSRARRKRFLRFCAGKSTSYRACLASAIGGGEILYLYALCRDCRKSSSAFRSCGVMLLEYDGMFVAPL